MHHNNSPLLERPILETSATALCGIIGICNHPKRKNEIHRYYLGPEWFWCCWFLAGCYAYNEVMINMWFSFDDVLKDSPPKLQPLQSSPCNDIAEHQPVTILWFQPLNTLYLLVIPQCFWLPEFGNHWVSIPHIHVWECIGWEHNGNGIIGGV